MRLVLIRHYRTLFNTSSRILGWGDAPRADNWLQDMAAVAKALRDHRCRPDSILCSNLTRSRETARHFARQFPSASIVATPQLNEINYGSLYGKDKSWVAENFPGHKVDPDFVYPEGESFNMLRHRCVDYIETLVRQNPAETTLCVSHAGVIRAIISHFMGLDYAKQLRRHISHSYTGALNFTAGNFVSYEEWGSPSGFITDNVVHLSATANRGKEAGAGSDDDPAAAVPP